MIKLDIEILKQLINLTSDITTKNRANHRNSIGNSIDNTLLNSLWLIGFLEILILAVVICDRYNIFTTKPLRYYAQWIFFVLLITTAITTIIILSYLVINISRQENINYFDRAIRFFKTDTTNSAADLEKLTYFPVEYLRIVLSQYQYSIFTPEGRAAVFSGIVQTFGLFPTLIITILASYKIIENESYWWAWALVMCSGFIALLSFYISLYYGRSRRVVVLLKLAIQINSQ